MCTWPAVAVHSSWASICPLIGGTIFQQNTRTPQQDPDHPSPPTVNVLAQAVGPEMPQFKIRFYIKFKETARPRAGSELRTPVLPSALARGFLSPRGSYRPGRNTLTLSTCLQVPGGRASGHSVPGVSHLGRNGDSDDECPPFPCSKSPRAQGPQTLSRGPCCPESF